MEGNQFADIPVKRKSKAALEGIQIDDYERCFQQLKNHFNKFININEEYFEGD